MDFLVYGADISLVQELFWCYKLLRYVLNRWANITHYWYKLIQVTDFHEHDLYVVHLFIITQRYRYYLYCYR